MDATAAESNTAADKGGKWKRLKATLSKKRTAEPVPQRKPAAPVPIEDGMWTFFQGRQFQFRKSLIGGSEDPGFRGPKDFNVYGGVACDRRRDRLGWLVKAVAKEAIKQAAVNNAPKLPKHLRSLKTKLDDIIPNWQAKLPDVNLGVDLDPTMKLPGVAVSNPLNADVDLDTREITVEEVKTALEIMLPDVVAHALTGFLVELGIDSIGAGAILDGAKLVMEIKNRVGLRRGGRKTKRTAEEFVKSDLTAITAEGVLRVLDAALSKNKKLIAFHGIAMVSGVAAAADPTQIAKLAVGSAKGFVKLMWKLWELRATLEMMQKVNPILARKGARPPEFSMQLFHDVPLLACYAVDVFDTTTFETSNWLGRGNPLDKLDAEVKNPLSAERAAEIHAGLNTAKVEAMIAGFKSFQAVAHERMQDGFCVLHTKDGTVPLHCEITARRLFGRINKNRRDAKARKAFLAKADAERAEARNKLDTPPEPFDDLATYYSDGDDSGAETELEDYESEVDEMQ